MAILQDIGFKPEMKFIEAARIPEMAELIAQDDKIRISRKKPKLRRLSFPITILDEAEAARLVQKTIMMFPRI